MALPAAALRVNAVSMLDGHGSKPGQDRPANINLSALAPCQRRNLTQTATKYSQGHPTVDYAVSETTIDPNKPGLGHACALLIPGIHPDPLDVWRPQARTTKINYTHICLESFLLA